MKIYFLLVISVLFNSGSAYIDDGPPITIKDMRELFNGVQQLNNAGPATFFNMMCQQLNGPQVRKLGLLQSAGDLLGINIFKNTPAKSVFVIALGEVLKILVNKRFADIIIKISCLISVIWNLVSPWILTWLNNFAS